MAKEMREEAKKHAKKGITEEGKEKIEAIREKPSKMSELTKDLAKSGGSAVADPWFWFDLADKAKTGETSGYWLESDRQAAYDKADKELWQSTYKKEKAITHPGRVYVYVQGYLTGINDKWRLVEQREWFKLLRFHDAGNFRMQEELAKLYSSKEAKEVGYIPLTTRYNKTLKRMESVPIDSRNRDFLSLDRKAINWPKPPNTGIRANPMEVHFK